MGCEAETLIALQDSEGKEFTVNDRITVIYTSEVNLGDSRLAKDLNNYLSNPKIKAKFNKFKNILDELQQSTTWVQIKSPDIVCH